MPAVARKATATDLAALAGLRWRQVTEGGNHNGPDRDTFVELFSAWIAAHLATHLPFLAEADGAAVGMAWLMIAERVPGPTQPYRGCGDVQSVYVVPELRDSGIGSTLLEVLLAEARTLKLEHVTVHANDRALPFYQRAGFQPDHRWLRWEPA